MILLMLHLKSEPKHWVPVVDLMHIFRFAHQDQNKKGELVLGLVWLVLGPVG